MLSAVLERALARGWSAELVLSETAAGHNWVARLEAEGVRVHFVSPGSRSRLGRQLAPLLEEEAGPAILHTHFTGFDLPAVAARRLQPQSRRRELAVVWQIHTMPPTSVLAWPRNALKFGLIGRPVRQMLCVGPQIARTLRRCGARRAAVTVFENAIDTALFPLVGAEERASARAALDLPQDVPVLLHFGWSWRLKGGDHFLRAVRILRDEGQDLVAVTVGSDPQAEADRARLGLADCVRLQPALEQVRMLYAAADLLVSSSRSEGAPLPYAVTEALSSGIPVVASRIAGRTRRHPEIAAFQLAELDPREIAASIRALLARPPERVLADAQEAHEWTRAHADLELWSEHLLALYDRVLP